MIGQSLKALLSAEDKFVNIKFNMEGPTLLLPESRENPDLIALYFGNISAENMLTNEGKVENLMVNISQGQVYSGMMGIHQSVDLQRILIDDLSCKMDIKLEKQASILHHSSVVSIDNIVCNINTDDIHLLVNVISNNILKLKMDIGHILSFLPTKIIPDEKEYLLSREKKFEGKFMLDQITINFNDIHDEDLINEERSASPYQDAEMLFQIKLQDYDVSVNKHSNGTSCTRIKVQSIDIIDVKDHQKELKLLENVPNEPLFVYEENRQKNEVSKDYKFIVETIHIYPGSILKVLENFVVPTKHLISMEGSDESIDSIDESDDGSDSTAFDSTDEEQSSGYQTSDLKSPQLQMKKRKTVWNMPSTCVVYHCSDDYRNNLLIFNYELKHETTLEDREDIRMQFYLNVDKVSHYISGKSISVFNKWNILLMKEKKDGNRKDGKLNISPIELYAGNTLFQEIVNIQKNIQSAKMLFQPDCLEQSTEDMWTQKKINKYMSDKCKSPPLVDILKRMKIFSIGHEPVCVQCEIPSLSMFLNSFDNQPILVTRIKISGTFQNISKNPEFNGNAAFESIYKNQDLNRWDHIFHSDAKNRNVANISINLGVVDVNSVEENLDEIPFTTDLLSIDMIDDDSVGPEEKLKYFYKNFIISTDDENCLLTGEDNIAETDDTDNSDEYEAKPSADINSISCPSECIVKKNICFTATVKVKEHLIFNLSNALSKAITCMNDDKGTLKRSEIINHLGHESEFRYTEMKNGREVLLTKFPLEENENSSDDEFDCPGLPWKKTDFHEYQNFPGFEEAGQDDINELTKVVTSHNLYIDVIDFKPMKIFLPLRPGKRTLQLTSELDHEHYEFQLKSELSGNMQEIVLQSSTIIENKTNMSIGIYVQSDNLHWQMMRNSIENPFDNCTKLNEVLPFSIYSIPLALTKDTKFHIKPTDQK